MNVAPREDAYIHLPINLISLWSTFQFSLQSLKFILGPK